MNILEETQKMINDLNKTNGTNDKMKTLAKYPQCKEILNYVYDEFKMYGVTSANVKKMVDVKPVKSILNLFGLLDALQLKILTGHQAIGCVKWFIILNPEHEDLIYRIIDKDLMIGMGVSNINKVFPKLIPKFEVALANSYDKIKTKVNLEEYYGSHKLDGLRCITIKEGNDIRFYSRKGKEFLTLDVIKDTMLNILDVENCVFDGELCIVDENGNEDFTSIMKVYKKKDYTIPNPKYKVFDMLTLEEFGNKTSTSVLSERLAHLHQAIPNNPVVDILEQVRMNEEELVRMQNKVQELGWEGLILRKDTVYKGKRTNDLLKVKKFFDAEYEVLSIDTGLYQVVEDGVRKEIETLTAIHIEHKGYDVKVGSGFSLDQRKYYYDHPEELIGKVINVQYFEETTNEKGGISLRFPTLKYIYEGKREV